MPLSLARPTSFFLFARIDEAPPCTAHSRARKPESQLAAISHLDDGLQIDDGRQIDDKSMAEELLKGKLHNAAPKTENSLQDMVFARHNCKITQQFGICSVHQLHQAVGLLLGRRRVCHFRLVT